jgi:hypothetical protein
MTPGWFGGNCGDYPVTDPYTGPAMSTEPIHTSHGESLELPVEELLRRARPLPPHDDMVIDDLTEEEGAAFLAALEA